MTPRRLTLYGLILALVIVPVLGFAAGDAALSIWNKHPRHASGQTDVTHFVWKTIPGVSAPHAPILLVSSIERLVTEMAARLISAISSPPFVPPRA